MQNELEGKERVAGLGARSGSRNSRRESAATAPAQALPASTTHSMGSSMASPLTAVISPSRTKTAPRLGPAFLRQRADGGASFQQREAHQRQRRPPARKAAGRQAGSCLPAACARLAL